MKNEVMDCMYMNISYISLDMLIKVYFMWLNSDRIASIGRINVSQLLFLFVVST